MTVIIQQEELNDIRLLLTQPSSTSNQTTGTAITVNPTSPIGSMTGAEHLVVATMPSGPNKRSAGAAVGQTLLAINISPPDDDSGSEVDMVVDESSPRLLPTLAREQQEPPVTKVLLEGLERHKEGKDFTVKFVGHLQLAQFCILS